MAKDNIFSWISGFTLSGTAMITGWIQVETALEVAIYGFIRNGSVWIGGIVAMLGKWFVQYVKVKLQKVTHSKIKLYHTTI